MQIINFIDGFLNKTPMYKLVIYGLLAITITAFGESFLGIQPYTPLSLFISLATSLITCVLVNFLFAKFFNLPVQHESSIITALIIFLILLPYDSTLTLVSTILAGFFASASKYILVFRNTHLFNPAAVGVYAVTFLNHFIGMGSAFWWVGSIYLLPIVLLVGLLIVRKTKRMTLFLTGLLAAFLGSFLSAYFFDMNIFTVLNYTFLSGPIVFFLSIMVTEPHTITRNRNQQIFYAALIVLLPIILSVYSIANIPPELSLLIANLLSFFMSQRKRLVLKLDSIEKLSDDIFEYKFSGNKNFNFNAGEYMEWNLDHKSPDIRGTRRYMTVSSAPNTDRISFATKFPPAEESSFKKNLKEMKVGDTMYATQRGGDFILPKNKKNNLIFIAGGIGITPFISQLRDLLNNKEKNKVNRSIVLFYCVRFTRDIVFLDILKKAINEIGIKVVCVVSEKGEDLSSQGEQANFFYEAGFLTKELILKYTQNVHNIYFISGPPVMVDMMGKNLTDLKVKSVDIHTDYFPGY